MGQLSASPLQPSPSPLQSSSTRPLADAQGSGHPQQPGPWGRARAEVARRATAAMATALAMALAVGLPAIPARAEPRTVATLRAAAPLTRGEGFLGLDLEGEQASGSSWLVGVSLQPSGLYGGLRRYTRRSGDRPFYGAGIGIEFDRYGQAFPGLWFEGGYELRLDRQVRALAGLGVALVSRPSGEMQSRLFLGLGLGVTL